MITQSYFVNKCQEILKNILALSIGHINVLSFVIYSFNQENNRIIFKKFIDFGLAFLVTPKMIIYAHSFCFN